MIENAPLPRPMAGARDNGTPNVPVRGRGKTRAFTGLLADSDAARAAEDSFPVEEPPERLTAQGRQGREPGKAGGRVRHEARRGPRAEVNNSYDWTYM